MKKIISRFYLRALLLALFAFSSLINVQVFAQPSIFDTSSSSLFSNDDEFLNADEAFVFNFHQKDQKIEVSFDIAQGYYLYKHQFKFTPKNASIQPVALPIGIDHEDEYFGVQQIYTKKLSFTIDLLDVGDDGSLAIKYQGCAEKGLCYPPKKKIIQLSSFKPAADNNPQALLSALQHVDATSANNSNIKKVTTLLESEQNQLAAMLQQDSLLLTLIAFFVGGLLLSFTPCVFPMYPILTGIIVGQGKELTNKKAFSLSFFYVQGMAITYTILGVVVALAGAQFQAAFQHPVVLISLSVLFIFLALSMFGIFNLALPNSWQNKLNSLSNKQKGGSVTGVVMMGVISGLVASPCTTAPLTGALLYISQTGDVLLGASALYALSLGMGLPLLVIGSSGGKILPKAGAWMNVVKNIFGLLLLAVPVFLLERIIPEVATEALWTLLILATGSYFYVINHNSKDEAGFWFGARSLFMFLLLFFGVNKAYNLLYPTENLTSQVINTAVNKAGESVNHEQLFVHVKSLAELKTKVKEANQQGKTVMVDLYADWCVACKEFEDQTFNKPQVQQALANSILVQIDLTETFSPSSVELMEAYDIFGLPSILFFNLQGEELSNQRVTGFMKADEFSAHIRAIFK